MNPCKIKHLTNMRSKGDGKAIMLEPPLKMSLERAIEYIAPDEYVEVTPKSLRLRKRILDRLMGEEFWTPYGTRTVSPNEANYDPDFGYQLVGGVWPNLTAWTAYCVRKEHPEKLVEGMLNTYRLSETEKPKDFVNVVPGEFPERLHGETFVSRGMTMSTGRTGDAAGIERSWQRAANR